MPSYKFAQITLTRSEPKYSNVFQHVIHHKATMQNMDDTVTTWLMPSSTETNN